MKKIIISCLMILVMISSVHSQEINFTSYDRITNADFKKFLSQFPKKDLPISTDQIISSIDIWHLDKLPLQQNSIDKYLYDGGELISGPLYSEKPDVGIPAKDIIGIFYPLYKLPTNGDYVMLVFAQVVDPLEMECAGLVFTLSYDLNGKFLYVSNYTYRPGSENINAYIDENLKSHLIYVYNVVNGKQVFPPVDGIFSAEEAHRITQINSDGKNTKVSFTKTPGQFKFIDSECRFKRVN